MKIKAGMTGKEMRAQFQKGKEKWTQKQDDAYDKKHHIKEGSPADIKQDKAHGIHDGPKKKAMKGKIKKSGSFKGKSNKLGHGGRAAQLKEKGVLGGMIGALARKAQAGPGQKNYHGKRA